MLTLRPAVLALSFFAAGWAQASPMQEAEKAEECSDYARALPLLRAEHARGNAVATRKLAGLYGGGSGVPQDRRMAFALERQAEAAGDALATQALQFDLRVGFGVAKSTAAAKAMNAKVFSRIKSCAEKGESDCMSMLASLYQLDEFRDASQAVVWLEKYLTRLTADAEKGGAADQLTLANFLAGAAPPLRDAESARMWTRRAAEQGYAPAKYRLAEILAKGEGGAKDEAEAQKLYTEAADAGYTAAFMHLGLSARKKGDFALQLEWYRKLAEVSAYGSEYLSTMYHEGQGVEKNPAEAMRWAYRAAKSGNANSQRFLGQAYLDGAGVAKDNAEGYKWFRLAAWQYTDGSAAQQLPKLDAELTPAERAEGLKRAQAFEPVAYALSKPMCDYTPTTAAAAPKPKDEAPAAAIARLPERANDFALIVGIERYRGLPSADYAETDAAAVRERLVGLGFPERNVVSLLGADATRSKLQAYLDEWLPKNVSADSRVFFYFSGHGSPDAKSGQAYLVPADGDPAFLKSTAFPLKDLYAALNALPARQIVAMLDSCFSGAGGRSVLAKGMRPLVAKVDMGARAGPGRLVVLAAADGDQMTGGLEDQKRGAFTHYLLKGLEGAAQDAQGRITAGGLTAFLSPKVADAARRQNRDQTPMLYGDPAAVLFQLKP